jgi:hypothetical protein
MRCDEKIRAIGSVLREGNKVPARHFLKKNRCL